MEKNAPENKPNDPKPAADTPPPAAEKPKIQSTPTRETSSQAKQWGMLCHITALGGLLIGGFGVWIGPLVIWLLKKEEFPFVDDQGKESLNFQITSLIAGLIAGLTMIIGIGFLLLPIIGVLWLVFTVIAAVKASEGVEYRYPFNIRLIK